MSPLENYWNDILFNSGKVIIPIMVIPVVIAFIYKKKWNSPLRIIFVFCLLTFLFNLFEHLLVWAFRTYPIIYDSFLKYFKINNSLFIQIIFYWKNFLLISLFYSKIFPIQFFKPWIYKIGQILALIVSINFFFIEGYQTQSTINPSTNALFMLILPLIYLWFSQLFSLRIPLKKNPYLWISLGLIIPNLFSLFLYFSGSYIYGNDFVLYAKLQILKNFFLILSQILISIGFAHSYYARFIKIAD